MVTDTRDNRYSSGSSVGYRYTTAVWYRNRRHRYYYLEIHMHLGLIVISMLCGILCRDVRCNSKP